MSTELMRHNCRFCRMRSDLCVCPFLPRINISTELILLLHFKEFWRSTNTGHLLKLCLTDSQKCQLAVHGRPGYPLDTSNFTDGLVLFPCRGGKPLTAAYVHTLKQQTATPLKLIVPDGTWGQTQRMLRRIDALKGLRLVELPTAPEFINRPRHNITTQRMSTFEAITQALSLLEDDPSIETKLFDFFRRAADRMLWLRGRLRTSEVYGGLPCFRAERVPQ